jgi:hypothetical protein
MARYGRATQQLRSATCPALVHWQPIVKSQPVSTGIMATLAIHYRVSQMDEQRTTLTVDISTQQRKVLKQHAMNEDTTMATLIRDFIDGLREQDQPKH